MGRLRGQLLERSSVLAHKAVDLAEILAHDRRSSRVVDQVVGCGTSVAANLHEADEAMSRADFVKTLRISLKELSELRFWIRFVTTRGWIAAPAAEPLITEINELRAILRTMVIRTISAAPKRPSHE